MKRTSDLLKIEDYYFSSDEEEFARDRSSGIKLLTRRIRQCTRSLDEENILKLINCLLFLRNVFEKGAILEYLVHYFKLGFSPKILRIIHEILVIRDEGVILNWNRYLLNVELIEKVLFDSKEEISEGFEKRINNITGKVFR